MVSMRGLTVTSPRVVVMVFVFFGVGGSSLEAFRSNVSHTATFLARDSLLLEAFASDISVSQRLLGRRVGMPCDFLSLSALGSHVHPSMVSALPF